MNLSASQKMLPDAGQGARKRALINGPVIFKLEDILPDDARERKDLTLAELGHVFKMYLRERGTNKKDISIVGQFSVIYNDTRFAEWHTMP